MTNGVDHECALQSKDFIEDPVIPNAKLVQPREITLERLKRDALQILRQPAQTFGDATSLGSIQVRELAGCRIEDSKLVHELETEPVGKVFEAFTAGARGNRSLLSLETVPQRFSDLQALVRVTEELSQLLLDQVSHHLSQLTGGHVGDGLRHGYLRIDIVNPVGVAAFIE
jgi:hypothetical protein